MTSLVNEPIRTVKAITATKRQPKRATKATRLAGEEANLDLAYLADDDFDEALFPEGETDDAPSIDDCPEWISDDDDDLVMNDDEQDELIGAPEWTRWVWVVFNNDDGILDYKVTLPGSSNAEIANTRRIQQQTWEEMAGNIMRRQAAALRCTTPLEALLKLVPSTKLEIELYPGQASRPEATTMLFGTPFGLVPLDFFAQGRSDDLYLRLIQLRQSVLKDGAGKLTKGGQLPASEIREVFPEASKEDKDALRKHTVMLIAALSNPAVVARHRALWPYTTAVELKHDLVGIRRNRGSDPVAWLILTGAFDQHSHPMSITRPDV